MRIVFLTSVLGLCRGNFCQRTAVKRARYACEYWNAVHTSGRKSYSSLKSFDFSLENPVITKYVEKLVAEYQSLTLAKLGIDVNVQKDIDDHSRINELRPIIEIYSARRELCASLSSLEELSKSTDKELASLAEEESQIYKKKLGALESQLLDLLIPKDNEDSCKDVILEVSAGVGGQEAMLFAKELHEMYVGYADYKGWDVVVAEEAFSEIGGLRYSSLFISGEEAFRYLKHEAGVHRVQRIPTTERSGRVHTSTVSVVVLPQPEEVEVTLKEKDLKIETKRSTGAGGQHVNTTDSAVRVTHIPSGIIVECQTDRSQIKNRKIALQRLKAKLYQKSLDEQLAEESATRKQQVRSNLRSEKIRTYNFNQDRITDHRVSDNMYNMETFLKGGELLDELIQQVEISCCQERLQQKISDTINS